MNINFDIFKKTFVENWHDELFRHTMATRYFIMSHEEICALLDNNFISVDGRIHELGKDKIKLNKESIEILQKLSKKIDNGITEFPNGVFVRLGSRSPKDSFDGHRNGFRIHRGNKAIQLLSDSERVYEDLCLAKQERYASSIVIRDFVTICPWSEFRCFVRNGKLKGISQYNYLQHEWFEEIDLYKGSILWIVEKKIDELIPFLPSNIIVDLYVNLRKPEENEYLWEVKLIEINPFRSWTDPCLFNWNRDTFEWSGIEFRSNSKEDYEKYRLGRSKYRMNLSKEE